jgi:ribosomal protein S18 acetylase RimI-like enzyme
MMIDSLISTGIIEKRKRGQPHIDEVYEMKFLDMTSIDDVMKLQEIMVQALPDKVVFRQTTPEEFRDLLALERSVIGVYTKDGLIAYNVVSFPGKDDDNFGADIGLAPEELEKVAHLKAVVVHPAYRGNQLQRRLAEIHQEILRDLGYCHVCSTVSPKNVISVQNHFASGFVIKGLKVKYIDRLRYIMYRNIFYTFVRGPEVIGIDCTDIEGQKMLIDRGLVGFEIQMKDDGWQVMYSMPVGQSNRYALAV